MGLVSAFNEARLDISGSSIGTSCINVHLPLPQDDYLGIFPAYRKKQPRNQQLGTGTIDTEEAYYSDVVATAGATFFRASSNLNGEPRSIVWRVLRKSTVVELDPVDLNTWKSKQFRKIRFHLPSKLRDHCLSVSEDADSNSLVLDIITESNYLYTISFNFSEFVQETEDSMSDQGHGFSESNSVNWRSIKYIHSFDLKNPHLLYAVSANELVASTTDGSLVRMVRPLPLSEISTTHFADHSQSSGLARRIMPWRHNDKVPGYPGLSLSTVISVSSVANSRILFTTSINSLLKVWSLESMSLIEVHDLAQSTEKQHLPIGPMPSNFLSVLRHRADVDTSTLYLGSYLPQGDGLFKLWRFRRDSQPGEAVLEELGDEFSISPQIPDNFSTWLVNDFMIQENNGKLLLSVLWKSNTSSALYQVSLPSQNPVWQTNSNVDEADLHYIDIRSQQEDITKYFTNKIFGPKGYSRETIETALPIYGSHYAIQIHDPNQPDLGELSLQDRVCQTVGTAVSLGYSSNGSLDYVAYKEDITQEWTRFDRLCSELQRQGNEVLSLGWDPLSDLFYYVKASFVEVVRPALPIELVYSNKSAALDAETRAVTSSLLPDLAEQELSDVLRLVDTLYLFRRNFSHLHFNDIMSSVIDDYSSKPNFATTERIQYLFETHIENQVSDTAYNVLETSLGEFSALTTLFEYLYSIILARSTSLPTDHSHLTRHGSAFVTKSLLEGLTYARLVVSDVLLALIATCKKGDVFTGHSSLYARYLKLLKGINFLLDTISISEKALDATLPFFQNLLLGDYSTKFSTQLTKASFANVLSEFWLYFNNFDEALAVPEVLAELLSSRQQSQAQELCSFLELDSFSSFIRAHVFLNSGDGIKARALFKTASVELAQRSLSERELAIVNVLPFDVYSEHSFGKGIARFFLDVSKATSAAQMDILSLQLAKDARLNSASQPLIDNEELDEATEVYKSIYSHLFESALKCASFDDAYTALIELNMINSLDSDEIQNSEPPRNLREEQMKPYVEALANTMILSGNGTRLCQYPFIGLIHLVTDYFQEKSSQALASTALLESRDNTNNEQDAFLYYRTLYAWNVEHQDLRGGKCLFLKHLELTILTI